MRYILFFLVNFTLLSQESFTISPTPFNFQSEEAGFEVFYTDHYQQMEIQGNYLYLCHRADPFILQIHLDTKEVKKIGSGGQGPGELSRGVLGMAVGPDRIWAIDSQKQKKIIGYSNSGKYLESLTVPKPGPRRFSASNSIACNNREVLVPISPGSGKLGMVIQMNGERQTVGELPFPRNQMNEDLIRKMPYINQTFWVYDNNFWYAAFPFQPTVLKFDRNLKMVKGYHLEHALVNERFNAIMDFLPENQGQGAPALVTDMKVFKNRLYVMCVEKYLFQIDLDTGAILSISRFTSVGENEQSGPVAYPLFAFRDNGSLFIGHPINPKLREHDLYIIENPPFLGK